MNKSKTAEQTPPIPKNSTDSPLKDSFSQLKSSLTLSSPCQSFYIRSDAMFGAMTYHDKTEEQLQTSIEEIRKLCKQIQQLIDKKIDKYYTQMREKNTQKELTVDQVVQSLKNQKQLRNQIIKFQEISIRDVQDQEKTFDSKQNIEFAIPIEINETKKKILELQKFIHVAEIKQKKKSEDVVKIEKINNIQFEKIAMLRTTLEVEMIYELTLNDREMKIDDKMYDFQSKLQSLNEKLAKLNKIVEEKHILVSSNKGLIVLKEKKITLDKGREDGNKKITLLRSTLNKSELTIKKEMEQMRKEILEKQTKYVTIEKELQEIKKKNDSFLIDANINKGLRKSISYNYAETLLKIKHKERLQNPESNMKMNLSLLNESQSLKPNFKVKKLRNQVHSSLSKMTDSKKVVKNEILGQVAMPITLEKTQQANSNSSFYQNKMRLSQKHKPKSIKKVQQGLDEEIMIEDD